MKILKNQLKEIIRDTIIERLSEGEKDKYTHIGYGKYKEKGKEKDKNAPTFATDDSGKFYPLGKDAFGSDGDVGGPAHPNVPKKKPKSKDTKISKDPFADKEKKKHISKKDKDTLGKVSKMMGKEKPKAGSKELPLSKWADDKKDSWAGYDAIKNKSPEATKKRIKTVNTLNDRADAGKGDMIDTERHGMVVWTSGDPKEDTFFATNEDGEEMELDYDEIIRFHNHDEVIQKGLVGESKGRRTTVKEIKKWMKGLEENRYKKTYNSDCRRVSWMVNNNLSEDYDTMPVSMKKKWSKAQYGRERFLAKEFIKHLKSKQMNEQKLRKTIRSIIKETLLKEGKLTETKFYAFWNRQKHTIDGKDLYDAKKKAIEKLKIPKSKVGLLAVMSQKAYDQQQYRFEGKLNEKEMKISDLWKEYVKKYGKDKAAEKLMDILTGGTWAAWDGDKIKNFKKKLIKKFSKYMKEGKLTEKKNKGNFPPFDTGLALKGNGLTIYDRNQEKSGDYRNIAHISDNGKITIYDKNIKKQPHLMKSIKDMAKSRADYLKVANEGKLTEKLDFDKVVNKYNKNIVDNALALAKQHAIQDKHKGSEQTPKLIAIKIINRMKEYRNKIKAPDLKKLFQKVIDKLEKDYKKIKEGKLKEDYNSGMDIEIPTKDMGKVDKILQKLKLKAGKDYNKGVGGAFGSGRTFILKLSKKIDNKVIELLMKQRIKIQ